MKGTTHAEEMELIEDAIRRLAQKLEPGNPAFGANQPPEVFMRAAAGIPVSPPKPEHQQKCEHSAVD